MLNRWHARVRSFFFAPSDARPLALFRIFLGVMMLVEAVMIYPALSDLYGPRGFLDATLMRAVSGRNLPSYAELVEAAGISYLGLLRVVFLFRGASILFFIAGLYTRSATAALWLTQTLIMASGPLSSYGLDRYFHLFLFMLLFMPAGGAISLDARWRQKMAPPSWGPRLSLRLLQLALLITYLNAGVAKGFGHEWWSGDAIWRAVHLPEFRQRELWWMGDYPFVPRLLSHATLFLETFYIVGVWIPYVGAAWVLAIIGMHAGIVALMNLANFGIGMALFNVALFLYPQARGFTGRPGGRRLLVKTAGLLFPKFTAAYAQRIFRRTRRYPRPAWEAELAAEGEAFTMASGLQGLRFGSAGPAVLLLHGWGGRGTQLGFFVKPLLAAGFRVVTFDGPGHGASGGRETDLGEFARAVATMNEKEGPFHGVVAHSFGAVAAVLAAERGVPIERFVLLGAPSQLEGTFQKFGAELGLGHAAFRIFQREAEERAGVRAAETHVGLIGNRLGKPALLIHDANDDVVPYLEAEETAKRWAGARLFETRGLGHRRGLKDPRVIEATVEFLRGQSGGGRA